MTRSRYELILIIVLVPLFAFATSGSGAVFCVGGNGTILTLRSDGWHAVATGPETPIPARDYTGIWGSGENDIYIAYKSNDLIRYDGTEWSVLPAVSPEGVWLRDVHGNSADDMAALGFSDCAPLKGAASPPTIYTCVYLFDGSAWSLSGSCLFSPTDCLLMPNGDFIVAGFEWSIDYPCPPGVKVLANGTWSSMNASMYEPDYAGGLCLAGGIAHCLQNGMELIPDPFGYVYGTVIFVYVSGYGWTTRSYAVEGGTGTVFPGYYYTMWGSSVNDIWLAGANGDVLHYDGTSYEIMNSGTDQTLRAMWGNSENYIFAVGDGGAIVHYDGSGWSAMESGTTENITAIWGSMSVVAAQLAGWDVTASPDLISLRWRLLEYGGEPFDITRTTLSSPQRSISIGDGHVQRDGLRFALEDRGIEAGGTYSYTVRMLCDDGPRTLFESDPVDVPAAALLLDHYPNPFNPSTVIRYTIPEASDARLCIYAVDGRLVRTLIDAKLEPGSYTVEWDGRNDRSDEMPSGIYILSLKAAKAVSSSKLVLVR